MSSAPSRARPLLLAAALAIATIAAFSGVAANGFIRLDDPTYVFENEVVKRGLTGEGFRYAWTSGAAANWHPLTWFSHMLDVELFGLDAGKHHLSSLALHVANALLLFSLVWRWTARGFVALAAAGLFALHPLRVESVAWIAERKDVLSGLWFLVALLGWTAWARDRSKGGYALAFLAALLGLLAKPMLVTLPCLLLVLDAWPFDRIRLGWRARFLETLPFFALAAASSIATFVAQRTWGAVMPTGELGLGERVANALVSWVRYATMTAWPSELAIYYPHPRKTELALALGAGIVLAAVTWWAWRSRRAAPWRLAGWLWYLGMLVPVIGLVQVGDQALADRYTYLPLIGLVLAVVVELDARVRAASGRQVLGAALVLLLGLLAVRTREQVALWKDTRTVFAHAVRVTKDNAMARQYLGNDLLFAGDIDGAIVHLSECVRLAPAFPDAQNNLGTALGARGRFEEAARCFETAIAVGQDSARVRMNLGWSLLNLGRGADAERECRKAVELDPEDAQAREKLGVVLAALGRTTDALPELARAIELDPERVEPRRARALALFVLQRDGEAVREYERVLARAVDDVKSLKNLAWLRATSWEPGVLNAAAALAHARRALEFVTASDAQAHDVLGAALAAAGDFDAAVGAASRAVELYRASGRDAEAEDVARRIDDYRGRLPFVRPAPAVR